MWCLKDVFTSSHWLQNLIINVYHHLGDYASQHICWNGSIVQCEWRYNWVFIILCYYNQRNEGNVSQQGPLDGEFGIMDGKLGLVLHSTPLPGVHWYLDPKSSLHGPWNDLIPIKTLNSFYFSCVMNPRIYPLWRFVGNLSNWKINAVVCIKCSQSHFRKYGFEVKWREELSLLLKLALQWKVELLKEWKRVEVLKSASGCQPSSCLTFIFGNIVASSLHIHLDYFPSSLHCIACEVSVIWVDWLWMINSRAVVCDLDD